MTPEAKPFIPGFETEKAAIKADEKHFAKANGRKGIYGSDFHIVPNAQGRWHFDDGPGPKKRVEGSATEAA